MKISDKVIGEFDCVIFENTIPRIKENRIGRFFASNTFVYHCPESLSAVLNDATILRASPHWGPNNRGIEYVVLHDLFEKSDEGSIIPCYQFIIDSEKDEVSCEKIDMRWNW